jgi:hypothetical protein
MTTPIWQQTLMNSENTATRTFGGLFDDPNYARTLDQINRSPTLQQDIIEFATGTGRFTGYGPGNFSTAGILPGGGEYRSATNTLAIGDQRLRGVNDDGTIRLTADPGPVIAHEIQHAFDRADVTRLSTTPDPGFDTARSPNIVWNNLLDEGEAQLRQYRIAKEIYNGEVMNYEVDPSASRPILRMDATRAASIEQWLADGSELYRHGLTPSADYLARANLAVDIGNDDRPSNSDARNYVDYYSNEGMRSAASTQRLQHLEITGIADGKISVVFSSSGADDPVVHFTKPITADAEAVWNAEICRPIPAGGAGNGPAPSIMVDGQPMVVTETISANAQGDTSVTEFQPDGRVDTHTYGADGSVTNAWQNSDGSQGHDLTDAQGNYEGYDYTADGAHHSEYRDVDGSHGESVSRLDGSGHSEEWGADGSFTESTTQADGSVSSRYAGADSSHGSSSTNAAGDIQSEGYYADGGVYRSWQKIDGSSHDESIDAQGNFSEWGYAADGSYSSSYRNADGSHGSAVWRPDGSSYAGNWGGDGSFDENTCHVDGSYSSSSSDGLGNSQSEMHNADGSAWHEWAKADGSSHNDTTDALGSFSEWGYAAANGDLQQRLPKCSMARTPAICAIPMVQATVRTGVPMVSLPR